MHSFFNGNQIFWTLTFAAQLTLLVVLLGRERLRRFPFFTASIALYALRLLAEAMLTDRLQAIPYRVMVVLFALLTPVLGLLVAVELARRAFPGAGAKRWLRAAPPVVILAAAFALLWGQWPVFGGFNWMNPFAVLSLAQFVAQKLDLFFDALVVETALLIIILGAPFGAGWRSHVRRLALGMSLPALCWLGIQILWRGLTLRFRPRTQQEYEHLLGLGSALLNLQKTIYLAALLWWIYSLWRDETTTAALAPELEPESSPVESALTESDATEKSVEANDEDGER